MDNRIKSIVEKRKQLDWNISKLAEKAGVSATLLVAVEKEDEALKKILSDWEGLISLLNKILDKAAHNRKQNTKKPTREFLIEEYWIKLRSLNDIAEECYCSKQFLYKRMSQYKIPTRVKSSTGKVVVYDKDKLQFEINYGWSRKFEQCVECGTTDIKHKARGLCALCYDRDIEERHKKHVRKRSIAGKILTKDYLLMEYRTKGKSLTDIAEECHCSRQYVYKKIKQFEIPTRSQKSARSIALKKGKLKFERINENGQSKFVTLQKVNVNENFFSSWSSEMAFVLGLIYTDGDLNKDYPRVKIAQKEPELLDKIKALMKCDARLYYRKKKRYKKGVSGELYSLTITNQTIYDDLTKLGLTPAKSLTINFPNIPPGYVRHFIRGCWDGDGTVYIENKPRIFAKFGSGSKEFIDDMLAQLYKAGLKKRRIYVKKGSNPYFYFQYVGAECEKLFHYLYDNVTKEQYLERKHKIFHDYFYGNFNIKGQENQVRLIIENEFEKLTREAHDFAKQRQGRCLSDIIKSNYFKYEWECPNDHRFKASFFSIKYNDSGGNFCPICRKQ